MENKDIVIKGKGIKVRRLSAIFIVIGAITMLASFLVLNNIYSKYDAMVEAYQFVEVESQAASSFQTASNYLTNQAREFAETGNIKNVKNYFEEKDVLKNRENALSTVKNSHTLDIESNLLNNAMELSDALVEYELHSMKLTALSNGIDMSKLPSEIGSFKVPNEELELDASKQKDLATSLLYSDEYKEYKDKINWNVESAIALIKDESGASFRENESDLIVILNIASMLIFILFTLLVLIFIFNTLLVVRPAKKFLELLDKREKLPEIGGYEFRQFAKKYNDIYRSNKKNIALLREQGEIDELTGALKVGTLELVRRNMSQSSDPVGIMMIDIDNFRSIKESSGYEMADKVVSKVANLFITSFKSSDYIIRTSQDEFELFLLKMKQTDSEMLIDRISTINKKLSDSSDGVVAASVSVGVAFSEKGFTVEAERQADMALNSVKKNGRGNCKISE